MQSFAPGIAICRSATGWFVTPNVPIVHHHLLNSEAGIAKRICNLSSLSPEKRKSETPLPRLQKNIRRIVSHSSENDFCIILFWKTRDISYQLRLYALQVFRFRHQTWSTNEPEKQIPNVGIQRTFKMGPETAPKTPKFLFRIPTRPSCCFRGPLECPKVQKWCQH